MQRSILIVEDEDSIRELVADYFKQASWTVLEASNGAEGLAIFEQHEADLVILDIMVPQLDGWAVCRRLRSMSAVPIIFLTAKSEEEDKLSGFGLGADDYVTKPFSPRVLVARAEMLMKRVEQTVGAPDHLLRFGSTILDTVTFSVEVNGQPADMSYKEFHVLVYLLKHRGVPVSREHILNQVWGFDYFGDLRVVDTHIKNIRKKLGTDADYIQTVFRFGYKLKADE